MRLVSAAEIRSGQERIRGVAVRTPLIPCLWAGDERRLFLKPELLQPIGSFKIRGGYNKIASLTADQRARGVVASSSGNHAQAVAYAARHFGIKATIVVPDTAAPHKIAATRALGADVQLVPPAEREIVPRQMADEHGYALVSPFDDPAVIAGQGTIGAEIAEDLPDADLILVPVSGGGLIAGIATAVKELGMSAQVVGVEPELAGDAAQSFQRGERVEWAPERTYRTIADALRLVSVGALPWEHIRRYVDDIVTVTDEQIRAAMRTLAIDAHLIAEPSGAVAVAAFLSARERLPDARTTVAIVSGGNVSASLLAEVLGVR